MTLVAVLLIAVCLFFFAIIAPHLAGKVRRRVNHRANWLMELADWFWDPITWIAQGAINMVRVMLSKAVSWGRGVRKRLPF